MIVATAETEVTMRPGQVWRTPGPTQEDRLELLAEPFEFDGKLWVAAKKDGAIHPTVESVGWILMGGWLVADVVRERHELGGCWASCRRCGMGWFEHDEPIELFAGSGQFSLSGPRRHECPPPFPRDIAEAYLQAATAHAPLIVNQVTKARIKLGLELADG